MKAGIARDLALQGSVKRDLRSCSLSYVYLAFWSEGKSKTERKRARMNVSFVLALQINSFETI